MDIALLKGELGPKDPKKPVENFAQGNTRLPAGHSGPPRRGTRPDAVPPVASDLTPVPNEEGACEDMSSAGFGYLGSEAGGVLRPTRSACRQPVVTGISGGQQARSAEAAVIANQVTDREHELFLGLTGRPQPDGAGQSRSEAFGNSVPADGTKRAISSARCMRASIAATSFACFSYFFQASRWRNSSPRPRPVAGGDRVGQVRLARARR